MNVQKIAAFSDGNSGGNPAAGSTSCRGKTWGCVR